MSDNKLIDDRIETAREYFRRVDNSDPRLMDLFTDDVEMFFPKFGVGHGKSEMARFGAIMMGYVNRLEHDIEKLRFIAAGDAMVVEGQERGVTRTGGQWPDGEVSQGRFCNVLSSTVRGSDASTFVDPDFESADADRIRLFRRAT